MLRIEEADSRTELTLIDNWFEELEELEELMEN